MLEVYDPATDTWSTGTPMPTARYGLGVGVIDGKLYVAGGSSATVELDTLEVYTEIVEVAIDIKPGSEPNSINRRSAGVIPVAILSSDDFDALTVVPEAVALAGASVKMVGKSGKYLCHDEDVNSDGLVDIVCQVYTAEFMIEPGESEAVMEAQTFDGTKIRGEDSVRIVQD